jgi:tetratricopeptide (TPR) repeat protein
LATCYYNNNQLPEAIKLEEELQDILKALYQDNKAVWAEKYAISLNNLATSYQNNNQLPEAIKLEEESLGILKALYQDNKAVWAEGYIDNLNNLATTYDDNSQYDKAAKLLTESISIIYPNFLESPDAWKTTYIETLNSLASTYCRLKEFESALLYFKTYFEVFSVDSIEYTEDIVELIFPFVKYYQAALYLDDNATMVTLSQLGKVSVVTLQIIFKDCYQSQIQLIDESYQPLAQSEDELDRDEYKIFTMFFLQ